MALWSIVEAGDERMTPEHLLDARALHADTAAVHQAQLAETGGVRRFQVVGDHRWNVARRERVQVERALYRDRNGLIVGVVIHGCLDGAP